jgi:hypothetical protein
MKRVYIISTETRTKGDVTRRGTEGRVTLHKDRRGEHAGYKLTVTQEHRGSVLSWTLVRRFKRVALEK